MLKLLPGTPIRFLPEAVKKQRDGLAGHIFLAYCIWWHPLGIYLSRSYLRARYLYRAQDFSPICFWK